MYDKKTIGASRVDDMRRGNYDLSRVMCMRKWLTVLNATPDHFLFERLRICIASLREVPETGSPSWPKEAEKTMMVFSASFGIPRYAFVTSAVTIGV